MKPLYQIVPIFVKDAYGTILESYFQLERIADGAILYANEFLGNMVTELYVRQIASKTIIL